MLNSVKGSLVLVDSHSTSPKVFWNGEMVTGLVSISTYNEQGQTAQVSLVVEEDVIVQSMRDAGITVDHYDQYTQPDT